MTVQADYKSVSRRDNLKFFNVPMSVSNEKYAGFGLYASMLIRQSDQNICLWNF